jgi:tellurite resistance protein
MCVYEAADVVRGVVEVFRAVDTYQEVQQTKEQGKVETKSLIDEAKVAKNQAAVERQEGIEEARRQKLSAILNMSKEKTLFASNNIATTSQTALNIFDNEKLNGELTALNTIEKSEESSNKYLQMANDYYKKANLVSLNSKKKQVELYRGMGKSFLSSIGG